MLHGCIPVIIADGVHAVFESILDIDGFGLRIPQEQVLWGPGYVCMCVCQNEANHLGAPQESTYGVCWVPGSACLARPYKTYRARTCTP